MRIDLHTHSAVSDGTDTPAELARAAKAAGLDVFALTDHDTFDGLDEAAAEAGKLGVRLIRGVEWSTSVGRRSVHLLGYGLDEENPEVLAELARIREGREDRLRPVLAKLAALGYELSEEQVRAQVGVSPSVGRPHIADALVEAGYLPNRNAVFDQLLYDGGPADVPRYTTPLERAIELISAAGGSSVLAHPWGRGRRAQLPPDYLTKLVNDHGLDGVEVDHQDHDEATRAELRELATRLGAVLTGGSDYHGTGKVDHDLGCNLTSEDMLARLVPRS